MIRHVVMWRLKEECEGHSLRENAAMLKERFDALPDLIPNIRRLEFGIDPGDTTGNFDVVLIAYFDNKAKLQKYLEHPEHQKLGALVHAVREERYAVDFEI